MIRPGFDWVTIEDAARSVGRSRRTVQRWAEQGRVTILLGRVDLYAVIVAERDARRARSTLRGVVAGQRASDVL